MIHQAEESDGHVLETRWTDVDIDFELGLENWSSGATVPSVVVPKRLFKAWIEDWEYNCVFDKDPVAMQRLLHKYGGLRWLDDDKKNELVIADDEEMDYQGEETGRVGV